MQLGKTDGQSPCADSPHAHAPGLGAAFPAEAQGASARSCLPPRRREVPVPGTGHHTRHRAAPGPHLPTLSHARASARSQRTSRLTHPPSLQQGPMDPWGAGEGWDPLHSFPSPAQPTPSSHSCRKRQLTGLGPQLLLGKAPFHPRSPYLPGYPRPRWAQPPPRGAAGAHLRTAHTGSMRRSGVPSAPGHAPS